MQKPEARTAPALLSEMVHRHPAREAVIDGARRLTYADFAAAVA